MRSKKISLKHLIRLYEHPSSVLFRSIELDTIYQFTKDIVFKSPSLDIGCGDGEIANTIFDDKFTYGVDNGEVDDYKEAITKHRYEKVLVEGAQKMSLPDNSINFAFSNSVLEHIPPIDEVLSETSRVIKSGGYFVFTVPSVYFSEYLFFNKIFGEFYANNLNKKFNHYNLFDHKKWISKLEKNGFEVVDYKYYISREALELWDIMLVLSFLGIKKLVFKIFKNKIEKLFENHTLSQKEGACLFFICRKA